ncbi:MAG: hypothetical protein ACI8U3_002605 [Brevundimonas sp.]|jgi:hypothetical protein|uniref:hypothetical protein n=1 Tax=Brevundimonas sp. TaxID=1871086 RepID=UPI0039E4400F
MSTLPVLHRGFARNRSLLGVLGASLALHAIVLVLVGMRAGMDMTGYSAPPEPLYIRIEPRPLMAGETVREPPVTVIAEPRESPALTREVRARAIRDQTEDEEEERRRLEALRLPVRPSPSAQNVEPQWRVSPDATGDQVARALRSSGLACSRPRNDMTPAERAACDERFAGAGDAPPIRGSGDPERDEAFASQGRANIARYEAQRAPLSGGTGVVGPGDCPGSNLGMGCAGAHLRDVPGVDVRQGAETPIRQPGNRVDDD